MWRMVMKSQMIVQDREIDMVQFQQVLQSPASFVRRGFNVMDLDWGDIDRSARPCQPSEWKTGNGGWEERREHDA